MRINIRLAASSKDIAANTMALIVRGIKISKHLST